MHVCMCTIHLKIKYHFVALNIYCYSKRKF